MRCTLKNQPMVIRIRHDLRTMGESRKPPTILGPLSTEYLLGFVPPRDMLDPMVRYYFDHFETTYRILHLRSFWSEYEKFWSQPKIGNQSFIITMLSILAVVSCLTRKDDKIAFNGPNSVWRDKAVEWICVADTWLEAHSKKHMTLAFFQVHCLILLAKRVNVVKKKRTWSLAQMVMNLAIGAGLHRDPSYLQDRISVFEQEMRRRLWSTICELELLASIERGMPPSIGHSLSDAELPRNIDDVDFDESATKLPESEEPMVFTRVSYLIESARSRSLRSGLTQVINTPRYKISIQEVADFEEELTAYLEAIPLWASKIGDLTPHPSPKLALAILDLQLRHFFLLLRRPFAISATSKQEKVFSRLVCTSTAAKMLKIQQQFFQEDDLTLTYIRDDDFSAALHLCLDIFLHDAQSGTRNCLPLKPSCILTQP